MLWPAYFILAYFTLGLQIGLRPFIEIGGAWPNLVLLMVIFIAINAPHDAALLGCFGLGVIQDLTTTSQSLGVYALSYSLVAMFVVSTQQVVYREHPLTHFSLALAGSFLTQLIVLLQGLVHRPAPSVIMLFNCSIYTAAVAPILLGLLQRARRTFGFQAPRRRMRI